MLSLATELPTADVPAVVRLRTTQARPGTPARVLLFWAAQPGVAGPSRGGERPGAGAIPLAAVEPCPPFARL